MLTRPHRLTKRKDFDTLFKRGKVVYGRDAQLRVLRTKPEDATRIAIVVSAKTEKSAVRRNRMKRQAREILRLCIDSLKPGFDVAITLRQSFAPLSYEQKQAVIQHALKKAGILKV